MSNDAKTTVTVYDPILPGRTREVPKDSAKAWTDAGWKDTDPHAGDQRDERADDQAPAANASREKWAEYAAKRGVQVADDAKVADIKAAVEAQA